MTRTWRGDLPSQDDARSAHSARSAKNTTGRVRTLLPTFPSMLSVCQNSDVLLSVHYSSQHSKPIIQIPDLCGRSFDMPPNLRLKLFSRTHSLLAVTLTLYFFFLSIIPSLRRQFWVLFTFHKFQLVSDVVAIDRSLQVMKWSCSCVYE